MPTISRAEARPILPTTPRWRRRSTKPITAASLCACSALPFIEQTVEVDGDIYCEGALVDTVNFKSLLVETIPILEEIWISRIVDANQVRKPENLHDALANLCQLFAATVGEDDIKLFKLTCKANNQSGYRSETEVDRHDHRNPGRQRRSISNGRTQILSDGMRKGREAADKAYKLYKEH